MVAIALIAATFLTGFSSYEDNQPNGFDQYYKSMYATAYCLHGKTYTGKHTRKGIAATGDKSLVGMTVLVYQQLPDGSMGEYIGLYEVEDTGCKTGVLDVWCEDLDECQEFMDLVYRNDCKSKVYCRFIKAEG